MRKSFGYPSILFTEVADRVTYVTDKNHHVAYVLKSLLRATSHVSESLNFIQSLK